MSFVNPFDQKLGSDDSASIEYFSGNPNPQTLAEPELVMIFKNLLRKDQTTREKACAKLLTILPTVEIDDSLHLAWVQIYAKLCFDISTVVRTQSHEILGLVYHKLGKKSTKYLKDSLSCWLCGVYDPVPAVSTAATQAFDLVFTTSERRQLVIQKFTQEIKDFCENVVLNQTPQTLSDERYISKEESVLKYDRVLKQVIDVISNVITKQKDTFTLLNSSKFWKLAASSSPMVARSVLNLATTAIAELEDPQKVFKQLVKVMNSSPLPQASTELMRALLTFTKAHREFWDQSAEDAVVKYLKSGSLYPQQFWPLFYNLALLTPINKPLLTALASLTSKAIGPTQTDIWGCFLTLCARTKSVESPGVIAVKALVVRAEREISTELIKIIASRFKTFDKAEVAAEVVKALRSFRFALVMAATGVYTAEISENLQLFNLQQLAELVHYDPGIDIKIDLECVDNTEQNLTSLLQIAVESTSGTVDAQTIASYVLDRSPELVLGFSTLLAKRGVKLEGLASKLDLADASTLKKAVAAHGGLVDDQSAENYVWSLATSALEGHGNEGNNPASASWRHLSDLASSDPQFIQRTLKKTDLGARLLNELYLNKIPGVAALFDTLKLDDSSEALIQELLNGDVSNLDVLVERAVNLSSTASNTTLSELVLSNYQWLPELWPSLNASVKYPVRYALGEEAEPEKIDRVLKIGVYLVNLIHRIESQFDALPSDQSAQVIAQLAICSCFCAGYEYSGTGENKHIAELLRLESETLVKKVDSEILWQLVLRETQSDSDKTVLPSHAYYAAQLLYPRYKAQPQESLHKLCIEYRTSLGSSNICAALLAQLHAGCGLHWYDRTQRQEYESIMSGNVPTVASFACIDSNVDEVKYKELLLELCEQAQEPLLQEVLICLLSLEPSQQELPEEVLERVLQYGLPTSQLLAIRLLPQDELDREVVRAASRLEDTGSLQNQELVNAFLSHCKAFLGRDVGINFKKSSASARISWVYYCCKRGRAIARYREQLESTEFKDTSIDLRAESYPDWFLYLDLVEEYTRASASTGKKHAASTTAFAEDNEIHVSILKFVAEGIHGLKVDPSLRIEDIEQVVGDTDASTVALLYRMSTLLGSTVRHWYRENNDRALQLAVDQCLRSYIVPATMRSLSRRVQSLRQDGVLEATAISERAREFRAQIEIDETVAEIVITLDPLFPVKNAQVQLNGLDGVPEHKKRGWIIEAEYTVQNGLIVDAMRTLILKVNNFLEGVEPCAICYSVMEGKNLPSKTCTTCKNKYHTECLYKWFASNKDEKNCPMCRSKMH